MPLLRRIFVLLFIAIWMAATQHCTLEAAGILDADTAHENSGCCDGQGDCAKDSCQILENGAAAFAGNVLKAPAPCLQACLCMACVLLLEPSEKIPAVSLSLSADASQSWVPVRHFERRAAPSPRAPSTLLS